MLIVSIVAFVLSIYGLCFAMDTQKGQRIMNWLFEIPFRREQRRSARQAERKRRRIQKDAKKALGVCFPDLDYGHYARGRSEYHNRGV